MSNLIIYKSSAGSGKTFTLVLEYLKILLSNPYRYRNILAITFTNKATDEMKGRIIQTLIELATYSKEELSSHVMYNALLNAFKQHDVKLPRTIPQQSRVALDYILNDYTNFSVSTIESFFQRIVRSFTRELNIPLGYDIEMQQKNVLEHIIRDMLAEVGQNHRLTQLFRKFLAFNLAEDKTWNIEWVLKKLGYQIFKEQFLQLFVAKPLDQVHVNDILDFADQLQAIRSQFEQKMESWASEAIEIMEQYELDLDDFKYKRKGSVPAYFYRVLDRNKKDYDPKTRARQGCDDWGMWYSRSSSRIDDIEAAIASGLQEILCQMVAYYDQELKTYQTASAVIATIYSFGMLYDLQQKLADYRKEHNQLIISDTAYLLSLVLTEDRDTPFIYERVGTRYEHYLLDEFQDTSDMQWKNLFPLLKESMSQAKENKGIVQNMIVGDVKQSIYRWRNGNMRLLMDEVQDAVEKELRQKPLEVPLKNNWRTAKEVVAFNNRFFESSVSLLCEEFAEQAAQEIKQAYANLYQHAQRDDIPGYVQIGFEADEKIPESDIKISWKEKALTRTLDTINALREEGYNECDITLLVRKNAEGIMLAQWLQQAGIKVVSAESLLLRRNPKVICLHALLKHLVYPDDQVAIGVLSYLLMEAHQHSVLYHATFVQGASQQKLSQLLYDRSYLLHLPVYECLSTLMRRLPGYEDPDAYVLSFLNAVLEYTQLNDSSITGFLEWWEDQQTNRAIASTQEQDAVQIMTIHKAKGLEFPIVIVPFADWSLKPNEGDFLWILQPTLAPYQNLNYLPVKVSPKLADSHFEAHYEEERLLSYIDNLNLLYVAFTRPQYRLYVFTAKKDKVDSIKRTSELISKVVEEDMVMEQLTDEIWELGVKTFFAQRKSSGEPTARNLPTLTREEDAIPTKIQIRFSSNAYLPIDIRKRNEHILAGELIHEALAFVETTSDIPTAVQHVLHKGYISWEESEFLTALLTDVVMQQAVAHWYEGEWHVKNEAEILTQTGELLRPDRVMLQDKQAIVIDYKTGEPHPSHAKQVRAYIAALEHMGYDPVSGYLYYLLNKVEQV